MRNFLLFGVVWLALFIAAEALAYGIHVWWQS